MTTAAMRCAPVAGGPKVWAQLTKPVIRAHRAGGATGYGPYPENAVFGALGLAARGCRLINYDVQPLSGGTLAVMHDSTVDRTTTGTGAVSTMSPATYAGLLLDTVKSYGPGQPINQHPPLLADMLTAFGAVAVHAPEATGSGSAGPLADAVNAAGLGAYACISVGNVADAATVSGKGIVPLYLLPDGTTVASLVSTYPPANGPVGVNYYQATPPGGTIDAYLQAIVTAGYEVHVFSINRRSDLLAAMASVAAAGGVLGGATSNDPMYHNVRTWVPRTADVETVTGTYGDGFVAAAGGLVPRVGFYAGGRFGYGTDKTAASVWILLGELAPLPATFTLTFDMTVEGLSSLSSSVLSFALAMVDLAFSNSAGSRPDGYYCTLTPSTGQMQLFRNSGGTTQTSIGSKTSSAVVAPLLLTGALTSGVPVTSLAVRALPASVPAGTVFWLPTGQKVTTSALAASGATAVTVASVTPSALVASGSRCPQVITVQLQVTSTQIIITRLDTGAVLTATDSTYRTPLYPFVGKAPSGTSVTFADGVTTAGSPVVTSPALAAFAVATDEDKLLTHANIPAGARILSVDSATQVTLTAPATASGSGLTMTLYRPNNYACWANFRVTA